MPPRIRRRITSAKREQIEEEQKRLEKSIVRPFDVLNGLPVSYGPPPIGHYEDVLKNPLTMKDSGVFYRSLLKSRYNYVHICPMFRLYWVKQSSYAKKLAAIDKPSPKSSKDDHILSSNDRVPVLGLDVSARDVMVKLCDAALTLGPHNFDIRLFIVKDERSDKARKDIRIPPPTNMNTYNPAPINQSSNLPPQPSQNSNFANNNVPNNNAPPPAPTPTINAPLINTNNKPEEKSIPPKDEVLPVEPTKKSDEKVKTKADEQIPPSKAKSKKSSKSKEKETSSLRKEPPNKRDKVESKSDKSYSKPSNNTSQASTTTSTVPPPPPETTVQSSSVPQPPPPQPHPDPHNMQSIENTIMISNLNTIARTDESLNQLMNEVASGKAEQKQILIFQGYIKRAREMGPQPHHAYLFANQPSAPKYSKLTKERKPLKDKKPKETLPRNQKLTAFQERYSQDATLLFEFVENPNVRFMLPKTAICEILPPSTMMNAEDGDNSDNSDVLVSFIWVHNQKEIEIYNEKLAKYKNTIKEREEEAKKLEESKKQEDTEKVEVDCAHATGEGAMDKEQANDDVNGKAKPESVEPEQAENKDAAEDVKEEPAGEQGQTNSEEVIGTSEIDADTDANADVPGDASVPRASDDPDIAIKPDEKEEEADVKLENQAEAAPVQKRIPPRRSKKKKGPPRRAAKKIEPPIQPEIRFTTLSFTIHGIPARFVPIVVNSFEPYDQAQSKMKNILDTGFRTTCFYLWYQIDGKLDEKLAEEIRTQLVQEEKKLTGVVTSTKENKKRPKKPKPDVTAKRIKVEDVPGSSESIDPRMETINNQSTQPHGNTNSAPSNPAFTGPATVVGTGQ